MSKWCKANNIQICSDEELNSYISFITWGLVNLQQIFIFGWTIPLACFSTVSSSLFYFTIFHSLCCILSWMHPTLFHPTHIIISSHSHPPPLKFTPSSFGTVLHLGFLTSFSAPNDSIVCCVCKCGQADNVNGLFNGHQASIFSVWSYISPCVIISIKILIQI